MPIACDPCAFGCVWSSVSNPPEVSPPPVSDARGIDEEHTLGCRFGREPGDEFVVESEVVGGIGE